ncbi:2Fe-2S ferredoxin [Candidatus Tremblaya princeps]|uniref:2Fe-2S ferredoxin n=1 Tax=Tremblaya princeps TaxID=189385 RepID=A0A143WNK5_TREPR|nr:2Fe-2S ferredoxin [Candidatus Tremblaya princeps]
MLPALGLCAFGWCAAARGVSLCYALAACGVALRHQCEMQGACASCRVFVRHGDRYLSPCSAAEVGLLGGARAVRLSCQCHVCTGLRGLRAVVVVDVG